MINVVFLLLVFFMMTTQIAPRAPFPVSPPLTDLQTRRDTGPVVFVSAEGTVFYDGETAEAALRHLAKQLPAAPETSDALVSAAHVTLRADAQAPATQVARLLRDLRALGINEINVVGVSR